MKKLRSLHLYLGCIFAPMLLFFAISGIWQTLGVGFHTKILTLLSTIHMGIRLKSGATLASGILPVLRDFIVLMALGFGDDNSGVIIAVTQGGKRRTGFYYLAFGALFPLSVILLTVIIR